MSVPNRQIGWSVEANLMNQISLQLDRLLKLRTGVIPTTTTTSTTVDPITCISGWSIVNLDVTTYANGDPIPEVTDPAAWIALTTGAWCHYNNDPANSLIYGRLYNWYAVNDVRGLAPSGYHVPSAIELQTLIDCLGGGYYQGGKLREVGTSHWTSPNTGATNSTGFTALPAGNRYSVNGLFNDINNNTLFWTSTGVGANATAVLLAYYDIAAIPADYQQGNGFSVRVIQN